MKLKKSDRTKSSKGHHHSSSSTPLSPTTKEAEWGLLSKENPVDPASIVPPQTSYHNTSAHHSRQRSWSGVFGFGRNNHNRSSSNHDDPSVSGGASVMGGSISGNTNGKSTKSKSRKLPGGYTLSRTPKSQKQQQQQQQVESSLPTTTTQPQHTSIPNAQHLRALKQKRAAKARAKEALKNQQAKPTKAQRSREQPPPAAASSSQESEELGMPTTKQQQLFSDTEWMSNPEEFFDDEVGQQQTQQQVEFPEEPFPTNQQQQQQQQQHSSSSPTKPPNVQQQNAFMDGFEITYENDADASRLTATTVGTTTVMSMMSGSSSVEQEDKNAFASCTPVHPLLTSPQEQQQHAGSPVELTYSASSQTPQAGSSQKVIASPQQQQQLPQKSPQKVVSPAVSTKSWSSWRKKKKKQQQQPQSSPAAASTPLSSGSKEKQHQKSPEPMSPKKRRSPSSTKQHQHQSPVAHAVAKALVASSSNKEEDDKDDDFGANDFDPNEDDSSAEDPSHQSLDSNSSSDDDDDDETDFTGSAGPLTLSSQEGSSAFQFNLSAMDMKTASAAKKQSPSSTKSKKEDDLDEDGFRILKSKSSSGSKTKGVSPMAVGAQPTACSSMSSLTPSSHATGTSIAEVPAPPPPPPTDNATTPSSTRKQKHLKIPASQSGLSQHTSGSSTLFPSYSSSSSLAESRKSPGTGGGTGTPISAKQQQSKLILSRPFGRNSLPANITPWVVQIAPAEWDNPERRWKYRIQVTRRQTSQQQQPPSPSSSVAVTWRSLENFVWLEHALNAEYQGGLLLPLLNIAVGMTDLEQATHEVDAELLRNWLSDVLNGIRGQGELILGHKSVDMLQSEAVEAFLYRSTAPLQKPGNLISIMMGEAFVMKQELHKRQREHHQQQHLQQQNRKYANYEDADVTLCKPSPRSRNPMTPSTVHSRRHQPDDNDSFVKNLWSKGALTVLTEELCVSLGCQTADDSPVSTGSSITSPGKHKKRYDRFACASRALGTADTLDIQDSFVDASTIASMPSTIITPANTKLPLHGRKRGRQWKLAQSTSLIQAERDLVLSYRKTALSAMEKVQVLLEEEENIGLAWKRFGIAVSNLFSYEKEVESARLGDKKLHRDCMPYRKIKKSTVDQCVRALSQQKIDRAVPALRILRSMLTAYVADLSAVGPSVEAYLEGMKEIAEFDQYFAADAKHTSRDDDKSLKEGSVSTDSTSSQTSSDAGTANERELRSASSLFGTFQQHLRSFTGLSKDGEEKKAAEEYHHDVDIVRATSTSSGSTTEEADAVPSTEMLQKRQLEDRVLANERLLRESLTTLCKSTPMRTARMAYAYFKSEVNQCRLLRSAAAALRSKTDLSVKEAVTQMVKRHQTENKEDMKTELALAQRMVNLGKKKYPQVGNDADEADSLKTDEQDQARALMRDNALQIARERVGRWNSDFAMAIMKAVGVDDPNVRVEQTTRELRMVRKYAIGLRENLNRCIEAVDILRKAVLKGGRQDLKGVDTRKKPAKHITDTRKEYFAEIARLFSGIVVENASSSPKNIPVPPSLKTLSKAGIRLNDPLGWSAPFVELSSSAIGAATSGTTQGECGNACKIYIDGRDSQTDWLLSSLSGLLNEYTQRVEVVESFVYMECVGVQLEKHFSQKRTEALTAFEKKTDVTTAINIATRKRIPGLVDELKAKLGRFGSEVTHTAVKEAKEAHLESKNIKAELHDLALRRLQRARETSTERVIDLLKVWMKEEESACISELNALGEILECLESSFLRALG